MKITLAAGRLHHQLRTQGLRIVFAESCTGGLVSASMATIPGVSQYLCGSAVTYRDEVKVQWLGVQQKSIDENTSVSEQVAREMAIGILQRTEQADIAAAITGHLGPNAPEGLDGVVFIAISRYLSEKLSVRTFRIQLEQADRGDRQREATEQVLLIASNEIENSSQA